MVVTVELVGWVGGGGFPVSLTEFFHELKLAVERENCGFEGVELGAWGGPVAGEADGVGAGVPERCRSMQVGQVGSRDVVRMERVAAREGEYKRGDILSCEQGIG